MRTTFQSCPGCESLILSDTFECPECGHVFDQERARKAKQAAEALSKDLQSQRMYDTCRNCGESVRAGLVRCWSCNAFMRKDVEARYQQMQATPQPIIFSDVPLEQRTELLVRSEGSSGFSVYDAEDDSVEFTLRDSSGDDEFELQAPAARQTPAQPAKPAIPKPAQQKPGTPPDGQPATEATVSRTSAGDAPASDAQTPKQKPAGPVDPDDLVGIALQDQREALLKKKKKVEDARKRRILMPCTRCGAWIRVHEDQTGKTLRCRQCKSPFVVPQMKKKAQATASDKPGQPVGPQMTLTWLQDVQLHRVAPTEVVLKPGSLEKGAETVDAGFHESGLFLVKYAPPAKKGLFGKADGPPEIDEQRRLIREHIAKTGSVSDLPFGELLSIEASGVSGIRLMQPVAEAHASMFAGVPVFGEGRIAVYLPLNLDDNRQGFLSFPISRFRKFAETAQSTFGLNLKAEQNGVPMKDAYDTKKCHLSEIPVQSLRSLNYYQADSGYELEVSGFLCGTCGIAVSEEARARQKLGGANGKGIAKAKCPGCSNKMGDNKTWKIAKAPQEDAAEGSEDDPADVLKPKATPEAAKPAADSGQAELVKQLSGSWKMLKLGLNGNFSSPDDVSAASIVFQIADGKYSVKAGDEVQEEGSLTIQADQNPVHLDQHLTAGADSGKSHLGIVRLVDGQLHHRQAAFDQPRPKDFEAQPGTTDTLAVFERV
ncbi:MAG: TIGR03067 domain-containing protein [Planctomycetaceae bacterium]